jgi:hypothetical protein
MPVGQVLVEAGEGANLRFLEGAAHDSSEAKARTGTAATGSEASSRVTVLRPPLGAIGPMARLLVENGRH